MTDASSPPDSPIADEGLRCLECDYNLTGLAGSICPECGTEIYWKEVKAHRDALLSQTVPLNATYWDSWPLPLKPIGFVATALEAAFLPWRFAAKMPLCPRLDMALAFAGICLIVGTGFGPFFLSAAGLIWTGAVCLHIRLQTALFSLVFRPPNLQKPRRFWLTVSCYTTYPVLLEVFSRDPPLIVPFGDKCNLWPFVLILGGAPSLLLSVLYVWWWLGLGVIVIVVTRMRTAFVPASALILLLAIPVITVLTSVVAFFVGGVTLLAP